ncbi:MAG: hypothetical protein FWG18_00545 [Alphaproteobacteria bacterium]|nr:hypothetical protein [Alphaproteobacteria bacterium]
MNIENEIKAIHLRNRQVEADKKWETSWTRKIAVAIITYAVIVVVMFSLEMPNPFLSAIIPTAGFILSTLSLRFIKTIWMKAVGNK